MIISPKGTRGVSPTYPLGNYGQGTAAAPGLSQGVDGQFDKVNISRDTSGVHPFQRAMVSRLVQETRTANTTGDIQRLRQEVQSGAYKPNPEEIASRMMLTVRPHGIG